MSDDPKPDDTYLKLVQQAIVEPVSFSVRQEIRETVLALTKVLQRQNTQPDVALTAMLNIMGSIIGTRMDRTDREKWTAQIQTMIPAYIEAYRVREKQL
jgi:hypothetical protein